MKPHASPRPENLGTMLPLAVLGFVAWQALPSLMAAWGNDLYSRGAPLASAIWLAPLAWSHFKTPQSPTSQRFAWLVIALCLCATGAITQLRACQHVALACALTATLSGRLASSVTLITAFAWIPATGWLLSRWQSGGLVGWERPALASSLTLFLITRTRVSSHANPSPP